MLREVPAFGALMPSLLPYFLAAVVIFVLIDQLLIRLSVYQLVWNPSLARFGLFNLLFSLLVFATRG